jgi:hydroxymethylpyrimidine pyrophosphatase-like HAD family hydrolase
VRPLSDLSPEAAAAVRYVLLDIDDTLTEDGRLMRESFDALWDLSSAGFVLMPVTGRPAGWCDLIARQWPVDAVVGENGAFAFFMEGGRLRRESNPAAIRPLPGGALDRVRERCLAEVPGCRVAADQFCRIYDLAIDFAEEPPVLGLEAARRIRDIALSEGLSAKISSIHVNIWAGNYDKLGMAERILSSRFGWNPIGDSGRVAFVGDSPNDEPLFGRFSLSCAVANYREFASLGEGKGPEFIANSPRGTGFAEFARVLVRARRGIDESKAGAI